MYTFRVTIKTPAGRAIYHEEHLSSVDCVIRAFAMYPYALAVSVVRI